MFFSIKTATIYRGFVQLPRWITEEGNRSITCNVSAMLLGAMWLLLQIAAVGAAELLPDFYFRGGEKEMTGGIRWLGVSERHLAGGFRYGAFTCIFSIFFILFWGCA